MATETPQQSCPATISSELSNRRLERTSARLHSGTTLRVLAIGSSSTEGVGASSPTATYPAQLEKALSRLFHLQKVTVINAGVAGETAEVTLRRLEHEVELRKPDLVLWQLGTNDALSPAMTESGFAATVLRGVALLEKHGCDIVLIDQQLYRKAPDQARYQRFVNVLGSVALGRRLDLFSRNHAMKAWEQSAPGILEAMLANDAFHMNDRGYACLAESLAKHIQEHVSAPF